MGKLLEQVFGHPRTTLAGVLGVVISGAAAHIVPQVIAYIGLQPGIGWQLVALALGAVPGLLMKDGKPIVGVLPPAP